MNRELSQCKYCKVQLRDTYFNQINHYRKCPERLPKPYRYECSLCFSLLITKDQLHNRPCVSQKDQFAGINIA